LGVHSPATVEPAAAQAPTAEAATIVETAAITAATAEAQAAITETATTETATTETATTLATAATPETPATAETATADAATAETATSTELARMYCGRRHGDGLGPRRRRDRWGGLHHACCNNCSTSSAKGQNRSVHGNPQRQWSQQLRKLRLERRRQTENRGN
jgi:hypothetical protein